MRVLPLYLMFLVKVATRLAVKINIYYGSLSRNIVEYLIIFF